jgi:hypothetical protein
MHLLRLVLEIAGSAVVLALHYLLVWVYILASAAGDMPAVLVWGMVGLGYVSMLGLALSSGRAFRAVSRRSRFDAWLVAFPVALALGVALNAVGWPFRAEAWDAHGFGLRGGEANFVLVPWLHLAVWVAILLGQRRSAR